MDEIRDLVYLDFEKASSIWSQFEGGLRESVTTSDDDSKGQKARVRFGIPKIAEANLGADYLQKRSTLETKVLHHDVLNRVDEELSNHDLVFDISQSLESTETSPEIIRNAIGKFPYIKATGQCVFEDYPRIQAICKQFNDIMSFINKCGGQSAGLIELEELIEEQIAEIRSTNNQKKKAAAKEGLKKLQSQLNSEIQKNLSGQVDQWLLDGIILWIDTFMKNRINFRNYPLTCCPSFQILCNLKRDCFVDQDPEHLLYGYGSRPNVELTVFGLITSIPSEIDDRFDPMTEFEDETQLSDKQIFENAFRRMFSSTDDIEDFARYSRYPNITVHPIAIYRSFKSNAKRNK